MLVMFTLAVLYKLYAALAIFYFLIFIFNLKKYFYDLVTNKRLILFF